MPDRLHLLEAVLRWPPETFIQRKLEGVAERGMRVTAACDGPRRSGDQRFRGVDVVWIPHWAEHRVVKVIGAVWGALALLVRDPRRLARLLAAIRTPRPPSHGKPPWSTTVALMRRYLPLARVRPDVVHFEWETAAGHFLPLMDVWGCPVVVSCRGRSIHVYAHTPGNESWVSRLPDVFERAAAVHCVSEAIKAEAARYGLDPSKARLIRPAVDIAFFQPSPIRSADRGTLRVITVADLFWVKGHEYALEAIAQLVKRGVPVRYEIVGDVRPDLVQDVTDGERILGTIEDLGLEDRVVLHGRLDPAAVRSRLQRCDALLHPSLAEGVPNAVLEAMACGLPVVVTDCGGTVEAVTTGREGFVVAPRDSSAMAGALERLWHDPQLRTRIGRAGRARVESGFDLRRQLDSVLALYQGVTAGAAS